MPKKILYLCDKKEHMRVFESFEVEKGITQILVTPSFIKPHNIKIPHLTFDYQQDMKQLIKKHKPNVFVQCDMSERWTKKLKKYGIKSANIAHGVWDNSPFNMSRNNKEIISSFDAMFVGTKSFKELLNKTYDCPNNKIFTNCLTQSDVLYNRIQNISGIRSDIIARSKCPTASKVITLFTHKLGSKQFFANNNDYYNAAVRLAEMARINNWLLIIKLKQKEFVSEGQPTPYLDLVNHNNVMFVPLSYESYDYFCADAVVTCGRSTIEIEACLANRPLIIVRTEFNEVAGGNDTLKTIENGCAYLVDDMSKLENTISDAISSPNIKQIENQNKFVKNLGLTFDGKAHSRVLKVLKSI